MCQYTRGSVFKFAQFALVACSQIFNQLNIVGHEIVGTHEGALLPEQNPSCVSAFKVARTNLHGSCRSWITWKDMEFKNLIF